MNSGKLDEVPAGRPLIPVEAVLFAARRSILDGMVGRAGHPVAMFDQELIVLDSLVLA